MNERYHEDKVLFGAGDSRDDHGEKQPTYVPPSLVYLGQAGDLVRGNLYKYAETRGRFYT